MKFTGKRVIVILALSVLAISAAIGGNIWAQEKTEPSAPAAENAWVKRCEDIKDGDKVTGKYCEAVQSLSVTQKDADPASAQRVAEIAIGYPPGSKDKAMTAIILPLGILVDKKVELTVDGDELASYNVRYCDNGGCIGMFEADGGQMAKLRKGKDIMIKSQAATGQPLVITLSLSGFAATMDAIKPKD